MTRTVFALLAAVALTSSVGCAVCDRVFGCNQSESCTTPCGGSCPACANTSADGGCPVASNGESGAMDPSAMAACGPNGYDPNAAGPNGCGPNAAGPNGAGPNGAGPNGPGGMYGRGPLPRGVGGTFVGPQGPPTAGVAYPYYTTRGPRDFLDPNPPSIGP